MDRVIRHLAAVIVACAAYFAAGTTQAQTPRITSPAARSAIQAPMLVTPSERAALASRLTGERIAATAVTGTVSVSVLAPVVGDPRAPTLSLEIRSGHWITTGPDPRAVIATYSTMLDLTFAITANTRYLVLCDMTRAVQLANIWGQPVAALTWEGPTRAAILVPRSPEDGVYRIGFTGGGELRRCEVSRLG